MRAALACVALSFGLGLSPAGAQVSEPAKAANAATGQNTITGQLEEAMLRRTLGAWWGGAFVIKDGKVLFEKTYGLANEGLKPFDEHTLFDLADNSMQFTAVALLMLEQQGKLSLEDPVSKFYPEATGPAKSAILRQVLGHYAGLSDKAEIKGNPDFNNRDSVASAIIASAPREPGQYLEYSRRGYSLLAAIIEKASGKPFDDFMRSEVFGGAGMNETGFLDGRGLDMERGVLRVSSGRLGPAGREGLFIEESAWDWRGRGAAGVVSCLQDMIKWEQAISGDTLLNAAQRAKIATPVTENYGLGTYVQTTQRNTMRLWHGGAAKGLVSLFFRLSDEHTSIFVVTNENGDADRVITMLEEVLYPALPLEMSGKLDLDAVGRRSGGINVTEPAEWVIARGDGGQISLKLKTKSFSAPIAYLTLSEGLARQMMGVLKDSLRTMPESAGTVTTTSINPGALHFEENFHVKFSDEARTEVRSVYRTKAADGSMTVDYRPMLIVVDAKARNWPLMVQMDRATAQQLYDGVWGLIAGSPR